MTKATPPKVQGSHVRGRLVTAGHVVTHEVASVAVRPLRFAFLINENTPKKQLLKYLRYNSTVWGGFYNTLIQTDGQSLRSDWWQTLLAQSPDKVIICGDASEDLLQEINRRVQPYQFWKWSDDALGGEKVERDVFGGVPLAYQLLHIYESSRPISKSNFRIVGAAETSPFSLYAAAQFGVVRGPYESIYVKALQAQVVDCSVKELGEYLSRLTELGNRLTPVITTARGLSPVVEMSDTGFAVVLTGENPVADLCLFWNLRMRPSLGRTSVVILPAAALNEKRNVKALADWFDQAVIGTNYMTLASATLGKQRLLNLKKRLKPYLNGGIRHVDVWFDGFGMRPLRVFDREGREELMYEDRQFRLKIPEPSFADQIRNGEWVVDVRLGDGGRHKPSSFLPPTYPGLGALLSGNPDPLMVRMGGLSARMAVDRTSYRVRHEQELLTATLPSDDEVFVSLFDSKRYRAAQTDKCRYARGVTGLMGGLEGLKIWRSGGVRDLFYAMRDGTTSYTPKEMMTFLRPGRDAAGQAYSMVTDLALKKAFLRGYKIQCPVCDLARWYAVSDLAETMPCSGCLTPLQPPVEAPFRYRLNDLVARGLDQGTMSLMLTTLFLESLAEASFMYVPGLEVSQLRKSDIDLAASCDGHLVLAECKDLRGGAGRKTIKDIIEQFDSLVEIARDVSAEIVLLSTLQPAAPAVLSRRIAALNKKWKKSLAVHLLTGDELERGYRKKPMGAFLSPKDPAKETASTLRDFLPKLPQRKDGWVKERGNKFISF
jgi:hypothetical protein